MLKQGAAYRIATLILSVQPRLHAHNDDGRRELLGGNYLVLPVHAGAPSTQSSLPVSVSAMMAQR